jgi:heat shock protein HslJ
MNKTIIFASVGALILLGILFVLQNSRSVEDRQTPATENLQVSKDAVLFVSPHTGESVSVVFNDQSAKFSNQTYQDVLVPQAEAASGARYVNEDLGLMLWNKGAEIVVYENDIVIFEGQTEASMGNPNPGAFDVLAAALQANSWIWQETQMNDDTLIVPKRAGAFVLTFDAEGRVSGQTDCNGFGGSYTVTDGVLEMGPFMMTKMYCEGSQEMEFQGMLDEPVPLMFTDAGELVLMLPYDSGSVIFTPAL